MRISRAGAHVDDLIGGHGLEESHGRRHVALAAALLLLVLGSQAVLAQYGPSGQLTVSDANPPAGAQITVSAEGFAPFAPVRVTIESSSSAPQLLATVHTDGTGAFSGSVTIPASAIGPYSLTAPGTDASGSVFVLTANIEVAAITVTSPAPTPAPTPASPPAPTPAPTPAPGPGRPGSDALVVAIAGAGIVLITGVLLLLTYNRRRQGHPRTGVPTQEGPASELDPPSRTDRPAVSVVLPCLDEAGSVALVVRQVLAAFAANDIDGEVVVADNGSTDGSAEIARAAGARVVDVPVRGYGAALSGGLAAARGAICVMGDADATYPFELLPRLVDPIRRGEADMVIGSRLRGATARTMPFLHRFVGTPIITWLVRRAGGPQGLTDSQSGFRSFRRDEMLGLNLRTTGMEYASEMLIVAGRASWRVQEVETGYRERIGTSKLETGPDGLRHLTTILLLAPDLAATLPGIALALLGAVALAWALIDPSMVQTGSPPWLASFFGPALVVLGIQAVLVGLLLAIYSPIAPRRTGASSRVLLGRYLVGGIWAASAGIVIIGALAVARLVGLQAPVRVAQIELIALVLVLVGGSAVATAAIAGIVVESLRRYPPAGTNPPAGATSVRLAAHAAPTPSASAGDAPSGAADTDEAVE